MKKIISLILAALMLTLTFASCTNNNAESTVLSSESVDTSDKVTEDTDFEITEPQTLVRVAGMTGPTSIGMVKMIADSKNSTSEGLYDFTIAGAADEITPLIIKGELDVAAVPANLASNLYTKTNQGIKIIAVNNLSVLYVLDKNTGIKSVDDLKGKTIYATGKGQTPEYTLRFILQNNGIDPDKDVTIEFKSEPAEIVALLKNSESGIAMLPQPFVTVAKTQVEGLEIAIDLGEEWKKIPDAGEVVTGVIIARSEFIENHPDAISTFLKEYAASCKYVNENVEDAAVLVEDTGIIKAAIAKQAIPYCNITGNVGEEMKTIVSKYLAALFNLEPKSIGGTLPDDGFYYLG